MATLAQPTTIPSAEEVATAEDKLMAIFLEHLDTLPQQRQQEIIAGLHATDAARDE